VVEPLDKSLKLPFDQYQRYRIVTDAIERLRDGPEPLQILDVGGGEGIILNFLPEDRVTVLDQTESEEVPGFVKGDATALPFEDEAYDYVVSVDVYEHIPPEARDRYLSELRRTARKGVLLAAPFDSDMVRGAERAANEFHRSIHLAGNVWLQEHAENGLPELEDARRFFEGHEDTVSVLPNGYIPHWLALICLTFYSSKLEGESGGMFESINTFYNEFMYRLDNAEPCYRYLLVSLKEPTSVNLDELASPGMDSEYANHSSALFGALSAMLPLATEVKRQNAWLAQHEKRLAQREENAARREARIDAQLAEYKKRLAEREGMLARREAQVSDLSRRLAERVSAMNTLQVQVEQRVASQQAHKQLQQAHNNLKQRVAGLEEHNANLERHRNQLRRQLEGVTTSRAWRVLSMPHRLRRRILGSG
jgi:hypothetical protein